MTGEPLLFPEPQEAYIARIDGEILRLLCGQEGPLPGVTLDQQEKDVLQLVRFRRGLGSAVPIREIQQKTALSPRTIKDVVRTLRLNFRLPIGSSKRGDGGYYIMVTREDVSAWSATVLDQVRAEVAVLRAAAGPDATNELIGQLSLEVNS